MTDVKTKAGREALRLTPEDRASMQDEYRYRSDGAARDVLTLLDALDEAEATIARLTAPMTDAEAQHIAAAEGLDWRTEKALQQIVTAFLEARKGEKK